MTKTIQEAIDEVMSAARAVDSLGSEFVVRDEWLGVSVDAPLSTSGIELRRHFAPLLNLATASFRFEKSDASLVLEASPRKSLEIVSQTGGDLGAYFHGGELERARLAWSLDVEAALELEGTWTGNLFVDLSLPLYEADRSIAWRIVRSPEVILETFAGVAWWSMGELLRDAKKRALVIGVTGADSFSYKTLSLSATSASQLGTVELPPGPSGRLSQVRSSSAANVPPQLVLPEELLPVEPSQMDAALLRTLEQKAEGCAWAWLSNSCSVSDDGETASLEFFGYRRRIFSLPTSGYRASSGKAFETYLWGTSETSPDRVLAIRQVLSLHDGKGLPNEPADVVRAADPLYRALRSDKVAAVIESQRHLRSSALDRAQSTADAVQAAAKSTAERTIASLAAVTGIAVAHATKVLTPADARGIALLIMIFFLFLIVWAVSVEGPSLADPIAAFRSDVSLISDLLSDDARQEILGMRALSLAERRAHFVRVASPVVYACGFVLTLIISTVRFG